MQSGMHAHRCVAPEGSHLQDQEEEAEHQEPTCLVQLLVTADEKLPKPMARSAVTVTRSGALYVDYGHPKWTEKCDVYVCAWRCNARLLQPLIARRMLSPRGHNTPKVSSYMSPARKNRYDSSEKEKRRQKRRPSCAATLDYANITAFRVLQWRGRLVVNTHVRVQVRGCISHVTCCTCGVEADYSFLRAVFQCC